MKALTIKQPWAGLIAAGIKRIENRSWYTHYRGPLLIHAGADRKGHADPRVPEPAYSQIVAVADLVEVFQYHGTNRESAEGWLKAVNAVGDTVDPLPPEQAAFVEGPWCWILANVRPLSIPCKGRQGLWTPSAEILAAAADFPQDSPATCR